MTDTSDVKIDMAGEKPIVSSTTSSKSLPDGEEKIVLPIDSTGVTGGEPDQFPAKKSATFGNSSIITFEPQFESHHNMPSDMGESSPADVPRGASSPVQFNGNEHHAAPEVAFDACPHSELETFFGSSTTKGMTDAAAKKRRLEEGPNELEKSTAAGFWLLFVVRQ